MKVMRLSTSPFKEVDPDDVVVTHLEHSLVSMVLYAYGYLRSEMTHNQDTILARSVDPPPAMAPGETYRVAYQDVDGWWRAEGTLQRQRPPEPVMRQIEELLARWGKQ
jgi:hypothetical protein